MSFSFEILGSVLSSSDIIFSFCSGESLSNKLSLLTDASVKFSLTKGTSSSHSSSFSFIFSKDEFFSILLDSNESSSFKLVSPSFSREKLSCSS